MNGSEAVEIIATAEFRDAWPMDVRRILVKAARTEGEIPAFAQREVRWAMRAAKAIEKRMLADVRKGEELRATVRR